MIPLPIAVATVLERLEAAGYPAYVVGGGVRDSLRGRKPGDWDLASAATPEQVMQTLSDLRVLPTGLQHGTVTVCCDALRLEVTTFRSEDGYTDGRHPDRVRFGASIEEDQARRDFTVNAIAYSPKRGFVDRFQGRVDLAAGIIRCVGDPDARLAEDALRILRGLRLEAETGFRIERQTALAMRRQACYLDGIARERVWEELCRILTGRYVGRVLRQSRDLLARVLPELAPMYGFSQHNPHHLYDVWEHTVRAVEAVPQDLTLRLTMLLHDSGKPACFTIDGKGIGHFYGHPTESARLAREALVRLRAPAALRETVCDLVALHDHPLGDTERVLRRRLMQLGEPTVRRLLAIKKSDCTGQGTFPQNLAELIELEAGINRILRDSSCLSLRDLAIDGHQLMAMGLHGPAVGEMLRWLLEQAAEGSLPNETEALRAAAAARMEEQNG